MTPSSAPPAPITEELVELIASGVDVYVATCDAELEPESMFGMGVRALADRKTLMVYLPQALAAATLRNLEDNGRIAVTMNRPSDLKAVQLKGRFVSVRASDDVDREFQLIFRAALVDQLEAVGVPRSVTRRLVWWPSFAVEIAVDDVFGQTPGPRAGERLAAK
jgi:hypothetical protein